MSLKINDKARSVDVPLPSRLLFINSYILLRFVGIVNTDLNLSSLLYGCLGLRAF